MTKRKSKDSWLRQAEEIHSHKYFYPYQEWPENMNGKVKVKIVCNLHGEFHQYIADHVNKKCGCPKCSMFKVGRKNTKGKDYYLKKFIEKHGTKYLYLTGLWSEIVNNKTKVEIFCGTHGIFKMGINTHLNGADCPNCAIEKRKLQRTYSPEKWCSLFEVVHSNKYLYPVSEWPSVLSSQTKVKVFCPEHQCFEVSLNQHQRGHGCPSCAGRFFTHAYVNLVEGLFLKFGVTSNVKSRISRMKMMNGLEVINLVTWKFSDPTVTIKAEKEIMKTIPVGIVSKNLMPDGHSETCHLNDLQVVIDTFEKFGGVRIYD